MNNLNIDLIVVAITTMIHQLLYVSAVCFWRPEKFGNMENPYLKNINKLQNPGHLSLTKPCMTQWEVIYYPL